MKTFLVPTDFSDTAKNAARYAVHFAAQIPESRVVLFNTFDRQGYGSDGTPLQMDETAEKSLSIAALQNHRAELMAEGQTVQIDIIAEAGEFTEAVENKFAELKADLVIMGINESNMLDQVLVGSNTLKLVKKHVAPVMIVPPNVVYNPIRQLALASDLEDVEHSTPVTLLKQLCETFNTPVHVVHIGGYYNPDERIILEEMLDSCNPQFHFLEEFEFAKPLNEFAEKNGIDLLVMTSRRHDFFERLLKKSHTRIMAYESHVPIIAVHESLCGVSA